MENLKNTETDLTDIIRKLEIIEGKETETTKVWELDEQSFETLKGIANVISVQQDGNKKYEYYSNMIDGLLTMKDVS